MHKPANNFYVTTPIYYVTAKPHVGSLYSTLIADVLARYNQLKGKKTFFLTGTDEHGQKIAQAAEQAGKDPKTFVDSFIPAYEEMWKKYEIDYSYFIRTTDPEHIKAVQEWLQKLIAQGDIYKAKYEGWYCTPCETYLTEKEVAEHTKTGEETPRCPTCARTTHFVSEESYFFRLSAYQDRLLEFYKNNPDFVSPKERLHEVIRFVESGLKDLSVSRSTITWGIPFPGDKHHVTYVWADALNNYITAIGYGNAAREAEFKAWWPADVQVLGKDIVRFHAVYWPAFLMASGLPLPKKLLVHGWIKMNDQKMSKSLGNVVDPELLYQQCGADQVRYYLMRYIAITQDSSFRYEDLEKAISSDLANDLGNLLNRATTLAERYDALVVPAREVWSEKSIELRDNAYTMLQEYTGYMDSNLFHMALATCWKFINMVNAYFHEHEPWKLVKHDRAGFEEVIAATCHSLSMIAHVLWPVMPEKMHALAQSLGVQVEVHEGKDVFALMGSDVWDKKFTLLVVPPLFKRFEMTQEVAEKKEEVVVTDFITIDDVAKVHLVVGTIEGCEEVPKSDKLYKMQVNFGSSGMRQILGGVRKHFTPEELIGKQGVFVFNLQPRKMLGLDSQGMMLLAEDAQGKLQMTTVGAVVPNGTRLR